MNEPTSLPVLETSPALNNLDVTVSDLTPYHGISIHNQDDNSSLSSTSKKITLASIRKTRLRSKVWDHFSLEFHGTERSAKCNYCFQNYKYVGSTSCLRKHLNKNHFINLDTDATTGHFNLPSVVIPTIKNYSEDVPPKTFRGRKPGAKNWTSQEIHALLDVINSQMVDGPIEWTEVKNALHTWNSDYNRSPEVYKEKYNSLVIQSRSHMTEAKLCNQKVVSIEQKMLHNSNSAENEEVVQPPWKKPCINGIEVGLETVAKSQLQMGESIANAITSLKSRRIKYDNVEEDQDSKKKSQNTLEEVHMLKIKLEEIKEEFKEFQTEIRGMVKNLSNLVGCCVPTNSI